MASQKPRTVLSLDSVLAEGVLALDEMGAEGLSLRELARRLDAGVASIYWYVEGKGHLIDLAADRVMAEVTDPVAWDVAKQVGSAAAGPLGTVRTLALRLFDAFDVHRWCPGRIVQDPRRQPHSVAALDLVGRQLATLGLTVEQQFHTATTIMSYVIGSCSQMATAQSKVGDAVSRRAHLSDAARRWSEVDPEELPFLHSASAILRDHDDREQFEFGLELLLAGVRDLVGQPHLESSSQDTRT
jgi:AcrR family transcriptional regulator